MAFRIKNNDKVSHSLDVVHPRLGLLRLQDIKPGGTSESIDDAWLEYFQQHEISWASIEPEETKPVEIQSIGEIELEKPQQKSGGSSRKRGRSKRRPKNSAKVK